MKQALFLVLLSFPLLAACSDSTSATPADAGLDAADAGPSGTQCTAARDTYLVPVAKVTTGAVKVISNEGGVTKIYIDASAGGPTESRTSPRVYIKLSGERVDITDQASFTSSDWDLAFKRVDVFTNSGDAGPGQGGAHSVAKAFDAVTAADMSDQVAPESFFDADCNGKKDEAGFIITSFAGWYDYAVGGTVRAKARTTYVVKAADGTPWKVAILSYTAKADGSTNGPANGFYLVETAKL